MSLFHALLASSAVIQDHPGYTYLVNNALGYWDARYSDSKTTPESDPQTSWNDLTANGNNFSNNGGTTLPKIKHTGSWKRRNSVMGPTGPNATDANLHRLSGATATALFNQDFELWACFFIEDSSFGTSSSYILGARDIPGTLHQIVFYLNQRRLYFEFRTGGSLVQYYTTNQVFYDGPLGLVSVRIVFNRTGSSFKMYVNGSQPTLTVGGAITGATMASFNLGSRRLFLHAYDNNGSINNMSDGNSNQLVALAVTGLLTDTQAVPLFDLFSTADNDDIVICGDPTAYILFEGNQAQTFAVCLKSQPGSNVTITPSISGALFTVSGALTFTSSDWNVPQDVTITPIASDGVSQWYQNNNLVLTATGGLSATQTYRLTLSDEANLTYNSYMNWNGVAKYFQILNNIYTATQQKDYLVDTIFNSSGLPSGAPSSVDDYTTTQSVTCHSFNNTSLTAAYKGAFKRLNFTQVDGDGYTWTNRAFFWRAANPVNRLIINNEGTGGEGHAAWVDNFLSKGFDVLHCAMPTSGAVPGGGLNITDNPSVSQGTWPNMVSNGVDQSDFFALRLFLFDRIRAVDYLTTTLGYSYSTIYTSGISAGCAVAAHVASVDTRVNGILTFRAYPWYNQIYGSSATFAALQARCPMLDLISILFTRSNAKFFVYSNIADPSNNISRWPLVAGYLQDQYGAGNVSINFENEASRTSHLYGTYEIGLVNTFLGI